MNQLFNPIFLSKILKSYFFDINRIWEMNERGLERYKDKQFCRLVNYAFTVPLYHDLYKKAGVHPGDIKGLKDIEKLPFVTKDELSKYYPDGLISNKTSKDRLIQVSTSGTTGRSLSIYVDLHDVVKGIFGYIRMLREFDINWRKDRLTIIGDFAPHTVETGYIKKGIFAKMQNSFLFKNIQWLDTNESPEELIGKINAFKPDFLGAYPGMLGHIALLTEKGLGENIKPRVIGTTGSVFDESLKNYVREIYGAELFETYGSTEAGPIAFECRKGGYHVISDYVNLEILKNGKPTKNKQGHVVVTKLYGIGTPIIRYTAMNDIAAWSTKTCECDMPGDVIEKVYGRDILSLYLPDGRVMLSSSISQIFSKILYVLKTNKVIDTQIIQHDFKNIEVKIVLDKKLKNKPPSFNKISKVITDGFHEKMSKDVKVFVKEVNKINRKDSRIISQIKKSDFKLTGYV